MSVDQSKGMLGTFAPQREPYIHMLEEETTPSGALARGTYTAKLKTMRQIEKLLEKSVLGLSRDMLLLCACPICGFLWMMIKDVIWSSTIHLKSARLGSQGVPAAISSLLRNWIFD
ncbi:hypothetical protein H5410_047735 [Solanum commersonii]|uniref:Uncharacterized protein n=1 Tax=Solanum commersonii TaxID=4109 RepID=A0A9J5XHV0_SOLCO|nr:hypothetical protein H5410_047735 [Solanum commersonii]